MTYTEEVLRRIANGEDPDEILSRSRESVIVIKQAVTTIKRAAVYAGVGFLTSMAGLLTFLLPAHQQAARMTSDALAVILLGVAWYYAFRARRLRRASEALRKPKP